MSYRNIVENDSAAVQAEMRKSVISLKQQKSPNLTSYKSGRGARGEAGRLAGLEIPFAPNVAHGSTAMDTYSGATSFERYVPSTTEKMYVGLAQTGFTVEWEHFHEKDASRGHLPKTRYEQRDEVMATYMQEHEWYNIGRGDGGLAIVTVGGGSGTITLAYDNAARGRSKGSIRLAASPGTTTGERIEYESYNPATDAKTATFYITSKPNTTQAVIVVTDAGTVGVNDVIVKKGHYKRVPFGMGYHFSDTPRFYQGANTTLHPYLNTRRVNGGNALVNPTVMDTAKGATQIRANNPNARQNRVCHISIGNYKTLAAYGYNLREYNAEKGDADTTYGLPFIFKDEDTDYIQSADMEEASINMRDRQSYFLYRQAELEEISEGPTQYVGTNLYGSTEKYQNWGESYNLAWDGRGDDGKGKEGSANSSVFIDNLAFPALTQVAEGVSLV
jgi:hypothetical protein